MNANRFDTVLVTGAFGQVGRRCTEILLRRGYSVVAMDLRNDKTDAVADELRNLVSTGRPIPAYVDLLDDDAVTHLVSQHQPEVIVHLAAMLAPTSYRNPAFARKINVEGTRNLITAAQALPEPPMIIEASSASVYGSRNPHRLSGRITTQTQVNPIDQYGEDKVLAEQVVASSGLPFATLRLAGVISPDTMSAVTGDYLLLLRATPGDNRMHSIDARDAAIAFANAVERRKSIQGKILLIAGNDTHVHTHREFEDDIMHAVGLGRLGPTASLPGDPDDEHGWSFTGWFDTTESQALLDFQQHDWQDTLEWVADSMGKSRVLLRVLGPILRPVLRLALTFQRRLERRGPYADPWTLIETKFGPDVLARPSDAPTA